MTVGGLHRVRNQEKSWLKRPNFNKNLSFRNQHFHRVGRPIIRVGQV